VPVHQDDRVDHAVAEIGHLAPGQRPYQGPLRILKKRLERTIVVIPLGCEEKRNHGGTLATTYGSARRRKPVRSPDGTEPIANRRNKLIHNRSYPRAALEEYPGGEIGDGVRTPPGRLSYNVTRCQREAHLAIEYIEHKSTVFRFPQLLAAYMRLNKFICHQEDECERKQGALRG
jgi:hypothetical protein